uniref:Capsid protein n=1 Tax=uncultured marine virus TaxID=186617 RepID=S4TE43_9VIRU|nr:hypothetical protein [uncultured marine virus]
MKKKSGIQNQNFTTKYTKMPATKRKYGVSKAKSTRPLKRRVALRTYSGATSSILPMSLDHQLLKQKQDVVLRYHETFTVNPGLGGTPGFYVFRSNSCYDPNFTGTGHQPRGYDQIMTMYQFLAVKECQMECWFTTSDGAPVVGSISARGTGTSGAATRDGVMEQKTAVFKTAGGISAAGPGYVSIRVKPWELAGTSLKENDYKHGEATNPVITQFLEFNALPFENTDSGEVKCVARITYHCQVTEPRTPPVS